MTNYGRLRFASETREEAFLRFWDNDHPRYTFDASHVVPEGTRPDASNLPELGQITDDFQNNSAIAVYDEGQNLYIVKMISGSPVAAEVSRPMAHWEKGFRVPRESNRKNLLSAYSEKTAGYLEYDWTKYDLGLYEKYLSFKDEAERVATKLGYRGKVTVGVAMPHSQDGGEPALYIASEDTVAATEVAEEIESQYNMRLKKDKYILGPGVKHRLYFSDHRVATNSYAKGIEEDLVRLGIAYPNLRSHILPVLSTISRNSDNE